MTTGAVEKEDRGVEWANGVPERSEMAHSNKFIGSLWPHCTVYPSSFLIPINNSLHSFDTTISKFISLTVKCPMVNARDIGISRFIHIILISMQSILQGQLIFTLFTIVSSLKENQESQSV